MIYQSLRGDVLEVTTFVNDGGTAALAIHPVSPEDHWGGVTYEFGSPVEIDWLIRELRNVKRGLTACVPPLPSPQK